MRTRWTGFSSPSPVSDPISNSPAGMVMNAMPVRDPRGARAALLTTSMTDAPLDARALQNLPREGGQLGMRRPR